MTNKVALLIVAVVAAAGGYYVGYDIGFEKAGNTELADTMEQNTDDPRLEAASTMLVGMWSSEDDRNFMREYKDDGTVVDSYGYVDGDVNTEATWELFTADNPDAGAEFQLNNRDVYIVQTEGDGTKMYFRIVSVTPDALELMYMDRGNMLRFGKMTTGHELQDGQED